MKNYICVYDFETDGIDPKTCEPVQIAACMLHPMTLEVIPDSEFCSYMKPETISIKTYFDKNLDTILWHAKNYNKDFPTLSEDDRVEKARAIFETWNSAPDQKLVFEDFCSYLLKYNSNPKRKTKFSAPIRAGMNIRGFDNIIIDRLCSKYGETDKNGEQKIFNPRDVIDIKDLSYYFFESLAEPKSYSMDVLREYLGMDLWGAHDALNDVRDETLIIQRFMNLLRRTAKKTRFKGALNASKNK